MTDSLLLNSLRSILAAEDVLCTPSDLDRYSADALTPFRAFGAAERLERMADAVVIPRSVDQVREVVRLANTLSTPIVPYGGGTGVMGAALPVQGGIVVDLKGLNKVLDISPVDSACVVEGGVVLQDLSHALKPYGYIFGHDPWSLPIATVAGAISTNGVGYMASAYGPMGAQVKGLEVVLPNGEVMTTKAVAKSASGPDLNHLFIGTEGVFGIIAKATLKIVRAPEASSFCAVTFDSFDKGFEAVREMFAIGLVPTLIDLTEEPEEGVLLYMMFDGYTEGVSAQRARAGKVCASYGGVLSAHERTIRYWDERHSSGENYRQNMLNQPREVRWNRPRARSFDYLHLALPVSKVLEYRSRCEDILADRSIKVVEYAIWTHPELFSMLLVPDGDRGGAAPGEFGEAVDEVLSLAQDMGGSMEYCHGVGVKLSHLLAKEKGLEYEVARTLKQALDPNDIMNPGKLFR